VAIVTLLTDFGLADTYVGQVKGAILAVSASTTIVDLTHAVPPQDVLGGAFLLWSAVEVFPKGTIHLAVVDPGVGSARRGIAIRAGRGDVFVGPDNGLLIPAVDRLGGSEMAVELTNQPHISATFHGRDVFAPAAGHLANGVPLERLGSPATQLTRIDLPRAKGLLGHVVHVDAYGNLVTDIPAASLPPRFEAQVNGHTAKQAAFYSAVKPGELLALVGSAGLLEISARDASAASHTGASRGTPVLVEKR
jgi:S-adenosylmethionine hydrolase